MVENIQSTHSMNPRDILIELTLDGVITLINQAAADFFKWSPDKVVGLSYPALCAQYGYHNWLPEDTSVLLDGEMIQVKTLLKLSQDVSQCNSGLATVQTLYENNIANGFIISGKLCAEEIIQSYQDIDLRELLKNLPGSTYWKDINGVYLGCSEYVLRLANCKSEDEIIGKTDFDLPWKNVANSVRETDIQVMQSGKLHVVEEHAELADGTPNFVMSHKAPLYNTKGEIIGIIGQSVDITELKLTQQALTTAKEELALSNQAKSDFLDNMRHDIRTPISCILGAGRILRGIESDKEKLEWIDAIVESSESLHSFFSRILDFVNVESGSQPVRSKSFSLSQVIDDVAKMLSVAVKEKALKLIIKFDKTIPKILVGDESRVQRIVLNLVSNAIKFTKEGHVAVRVRLAKRADRDAVIQIVVQDTGVGIPKDKIDMIFEKFNRLSHSYSGNYNGEGLGLSIVMQYLNDLEGEVDVTSQVGIGSTFTCTIPFRISLLEE